VSILKKRDKLIVAGIIIVLTVAIIVYPYTFGGEGKLEITVILEKPKMSVKEEISATVIVKNVDNHPIRVLEPVYTLWLYLTYLNSSNVHYKGPVYSLAAPSDRALITLNPQETITRTYHISNRTWEISSDSKYMVYARLKYMGEDDKYLTLPHWKGTLISNGYELEVTD
jgi:hypothetical protein